MAPSELVMADGDYFRTDSVCLIRTLDVDRPGCFPCTVRSKEHYRTLSLLFSSSLPQETGIYTVHVHVNVHVVGFNVERHCHAGGHAVCSVAQSDVWVWRDRHPRVRPGALNLDDLCCVASNNKLRLGGLHVIPTSSHFGLKLAS